MAAAMGSLMGIWVLVALFVAILWILMPFAIFGTKPLLKTLIAEQKKTNRLLEAAAERGKLPTDVVLVSTRKQDA
ncbi:hypothetical protein LJR099_003010 [Variovorax paradoxus]|uniref:hypothetical protein n=1 Tax=Variovorax paradoxus TaxID=34073 RepID=UPI00399B4107